MKEWEDKKISEDEEKEMNRSLEELIELAKEIE